MEKIRPSDAKTSASFFLVFSVLAAVLIAAGYIYYRHYERSHRIEVERQLSSIVELKTDELTQWRKERLADGATFFHNRSFSTLVRRFFETPSDTDTRYQLVDWLDTFIAFHGYDQIRLVDSRGVTRLCLPADSPPADPTSSRTAAEVMRTGHVAIQDFYRDEEGQHVYAQVMVPLFNGSNTNQPLGVLQLRVDPTTYIYPFIKLWPVPSRSAETLIIRREGDDVLYLNELRFQSNASLRLRIPLTRTDIPAVKAALGETGIKEGVDYRGIPVLAAIQAVPDSPWRLVAKMELEEIQGVVHERLWLVAVMLSILLLTSWILVDQIWRRQRIRLHKAQSEALRRTEEHHQAIIQTAMDGFWLSDTQGRLLEVNTAYCRMSGYSEKELLAMRIPDLEATETSIDTARHIIKIIEQGEDRFETRHRRKDGTFFDLEVSAQYRSTGNGQVVAFMHDITKRKQAEATLKASQEKFRNIINASPMGMHLYEVTGDGRIIFIGANPAADRILGIDHAPFTGRPLEEVFPALIGTEIPDRYREAALHGTIWRNDQLIYETGPIKGAFEVVAFQTEPGKMVAMFNDITARRQAQQEKEKLQTQLLQAQKMESVGRLAGGVAHDFNNLLMGILGYAELSRDELPPEHPAQIFLDEIIKTARRSADLTRQLLSFARKQIITPRILDLNEAMAGMIKLLRRLIGENIELVLMPGPDLWPIKFDSSQLDQILANLCVNARDAITGSGTITLATANVTVGKVICARLPDATPGDYVQLTVSDTGCGMEKDVLDHIFEPFFTTKGIGEGTGLGMATVYGIVRQNNGFIDVRSEPGKGTTFTLYLPRYNGPITEPPVANAPTPPHGEGETILLVEDEPSLRTSCSLFLTGIGYKVLLAGTPEEALSLTDSFHDRIHLLLTDVIMPGMNGRQLADRILANRPDTRCLFMSGYTANEISSAGVLDEGVNFIQKPFSREELARKVRSVLA